MKIILIFLVINVISIFISKFIHIDLKMLGANYIRIGDIISVYLVPFILINMTYFMYLVNTENEELFELIEKTQNWFDKKDEEK